MSWVAAAVVGGSVISSYSSSRSASKAASSQESANLAAIEAQREQFEKQIELLDPFRQLGVDALPGLAALSTPEGQAEFYQQYYQSPQFTAQANAAQNAQLASAEATGGLQSTSTQNQLARIAPTLGTSALQAQQNQLGQLANIGLSGAGSQAGYAGQFGAAQAAGLQGIGQAQAGAQLAQGQAISGGINSALGGLLYGSAAGLF